MTSAGNESWYLYTDSRTKLTPSLTHWALETNALTIEDRPEAAKHQNGLNQIISSRYTRELRSFINFAYQAKPNPMLTKLQFKIYQRGLKITPYRGNDSLLASDWLDIGWDEGGELWLVAAGAGGGLYRPLGPEFCCKTVLMYEKIVYLDSKWI